VHLVRRHQRHLVAATAALETNAKSRRTAGNELRHEFSSEAGSMIRAISVSETG
jgi:hypothetical protein